MKRGIIWIALTFATDRIAGIGILFFINHGYLNN